MPIKSSTRTVESIVILDHVLLQFSYGGEHQKDQSGKPIPAGRLSGAQIGYKEYEIDGDGKIVREVVNSPDAVVRPITLDEAKQILGDQAGDLIAQTDAARIEVETHRAALKAADEAVAEANRLQRRAEKLLASKTADHLAAQAVIAQQTGRIEKLKDAMIRADAREAARKEAAAERERERQ